MTDLPAADLVLTRAIEERMLNAWPAIETVAAGDWLLRFANGYSKRSNSAATLGPGADMDDADIDGLTRRAAAWGIAPAVRLTPLCAKDLDARLGERGFSVIDPTFGMAMEIAPGDKVHADGLACAFARAPEPSWIAANAAAYGGVKANAAHLEAILTRIRQPVAFATLTAEGSAVAWGIGVVERGMIGLQDLVVAPSARGQKYGRALVQSLIAWGAENGASQAYLHVTAANAPARALYRSLGFTDVYEINYRVGVRA